MFEIVPAIPPEVGTEELRTSLTVNVLSMKKSNEFSKGKIIDCKRFNNLKKLPTASVLVLRIVRKMKCIFDWKEKGWPWGHVNASEKFWVRVVEVWTAFYYSR